MRIPVTSNAESTQSLWLLEDWVRLAGEGGGGEAEEDRPGSGSPNRRLCHLSLSSLGLVGSQPLDGLILDKFGPGEA